MDAQRHDERNRTEARSGEAWPDDATLAWLTDPADPALRARVLVDLLGREEDDPEVLQARGRIPEQPFVRAALGAWTDGRVAALNPYQKYRGATWTLAFLASMGLPAEHPVAVQGAEYLLETATRTERLRERRVAPLHGERGAYWLSPIACLTARMLSVLARFGYADHPVARGARATLVHLHLPGHGLDCRVMDRSLLPGCVMTVPEVLQGMLSVPEAERTDAEAEVIADLAEVLLRVDLYRYVPTQSGAFRETMDGVPVAEVRRAKAAWAAEGRLEPRAEKPGWLRLHFPHGYNRDLLDALWALAAAGVPPDAAIERALDVLRSTRTPAGRWKQRGGLNGKMWADRGVKGREDPWITYRALTVLKRFGALRTAA